MLPLGTLTAICSLTILLPTSLAATCYGSKGVDPKGSIQSAWKLRDAVCGHNACATSDAEQGNNHHCVISLPFAATAEVKLQRNDPSGRYPNCYAATENIIQQCFSDASSSFDASSDPNGSWSVGDEWYWITMNYTMSTPDSEGDDEESAGSPNGGTLMGPSRFCQGFAPGGSDSCTNIPVGCYIDVPIDNTVPKVQCDLPLNP